MLGVYNYQFNPNTLSCNAINLEEAFIGHQIQEIEVKGFSVFDEYLSPNEGHPEGIEKHLKLAEKGLHVCTGTERSFFHLLCADSNKCQGVIIRDINPQVKAYVDFNLMLIRISNTREKYNLWSSMISNYEQFQETICAIIHQIKDADLPQKIQEYYLKNARVFGEIYQKTDKSWRMNPLFEKVNYCLHDHLFQKIKSYAMEGNIISTVGKINDLLFLKSYNVSVVDTSNISDYSMIDLNAEENFHPRVIWTRLRNPRNTDSPICIQTKYYSYPHQPLDRDEREKFGRLKQKITLALNLKNFDSWLSINAATPYETDVFSSDVGPFYTKNTLKYLEDFVDIGIFHFKSLYPIYMHNKENLKTFNTLNMNQLLTIASSQEIKPFAASLVANWHVFNASVITIFSYIEEWQTAFEKHLKYSPDDLEKFLSCLGRANKLDEFTSSFGEQRLAGLEKSCREALNKNNKSHRKIG